MRVKIAVAAVSLLVASLAGSLSAHAAVASVACTGLLTGSVHDTVIVPVNGNCFIADATVDGNVVVNTGGALELGVAQRPSTQRNVIHGSVLSSPTIGSFTTFGHNTIDGNVVLNGLRAQPPESNGMNLCDTTIGGNLVVTNAQPGATFVVIGVGQFACPGVQISGNTFLGGNNLPNGPLHGVLMATSRVGGTLQVTGNVGGGALIANTIGGALLCGSNAPPLTANTNTAGGPNQAAAGTC